MSKLFYSFVVFSLAVLLPLKAQGFVVPADGSTISIELNPGAYKVRVVGIYAYGTQDWAIADCEWLRLNDYSWYEYTPLDPERKICDLTVNGLFCDWEGKQPDGSYLPHLLSPSHQYSTALQLGGRVDFQIYDPWYSTDNSGYLEVYIESVPEPATIIGLALGSAFFLRRRR